MSGLHELDHYLKDDGPAALVIREWLTPVEGTDGVLFPATYAASPTFPGGYNVDTAPNGKTVCLIDSVGSQANRLEPLFKTEKYSHLVPQIVVNAGDKEVNLLDAGHRAGDAIVRCSSLQQQFQQAFGSLLKGDAEKLAKLAPTSLVFGVWDSRDTYAKVPRLVSSSIRAFDVRELHRGAVYTAPVNYSELDVFSEEEKAKAEGDSKNPLAKRGFVNALASWSHGGVIADGGIRRDATLSLAALRLLFAGKDANRTLALRRYILGLALTAFTHPVPSYLRQGCMLVLDANRTREFVEVFPTGERKPASITHPAALAFATSAAKAFGVGEDKTAPFEKERAKRDVGGGDAKGTRVKGAVSALDAGARTFSVGTGAKKVDVTTSESTTYFKGDEESTFDVVVVLKAKVEVEVSDSAAVKVTAK